MNFRWKQMLLVLLLLVMSGVMVLAQSGNANVIDMAERLNIRSEPSGRAEVVGDVGGNDALNVIGRNSTNRWYQITTIDGAVTGWVASGFVDLRVARADIPVVGAGAPAAPPAVESQPEGNENAPVGNFDGAVGTVRVVAANVRASDSTRAAIIDQLTNGQRVPVLARNAASTWVQVQLDGRVGWIFADLLDLNVSRGALPSISGGVIANTPANDAPAAENANDNANDNAVVNVPAGEAPYFTLGASAVNIYATGQALGRRANVFAKVGDSITVDEELFGPFGFGVYNLGDYGYLRPTIGFFSAQARNNNSFNNTSLAAGRGYTTRTILDSDFANNQVCNFGESPLACEYRTTNPAVALILLGTNDTAMVPIDEFAYNMAVIADYSIGQGVIPVMTTIPPRLEFPGRAESYNQVIIGVAAQRGLPLIDLYGALVGLPNAGMNPDGIHPSSPPLGFEQAADFRGNNLQYGHVVRNLITLQALHSLRVNVLQ